MDIGLSTAGESAPQTTSSLLGEMGQSQQLSQSGVFSVLLKDAAQKMDDPIEPVLPAAVDGHATEAALIAIAGETCSHLRDLQEAAVPPADKAEASPDFTGLTQQGIESMLFIPPAVAEAAPHHNGTLGDAPLSAAPPQARTADATMSSSLQPLVDPAGNDVEPAMAAKQTATEVQAEPPIRNGRGVLVHAVPVPLEPPSGDSVPSGTLPSGSLPPNHSPIPAREQQGEKIVHSATDANGNMQPLDRPSPDRRPSSIIQEQGSREITAAGPSLSIRMVGGSGGQDPFGASAQGDGAGANYHSGGSEVPESGVRGTQSTLFSDLSTAARQTQSLPQGAGTSAVPPATYQLKLAQAFLGESHQANMNVVRGTAQTVHVELPSHEAGPMSVRISMQDQTVHTQFTTDRSDLGAILAGRQDQLQQSLTRSGLELGQFQVHVNQEGRQEALPDRQSRRNGGMSDQPPPSQDHRDQSHGRDRSGHRSTHALSLFA